MSAAARRVGQCPSCLCLDTRFDDFILSPRRRVLLRAGRAQPLIPRYFDLLVFLVERRGDAVHRRDIFDAVWTDVIVSDSALSQAIRTIRRVLGDDPREPRFVRTVSRHGYQFVHARVIEEEDQADILAETSPSGSATDPESVDPYPQLLERIAHTPATPLDEEDQRDAAERLHALGTAEALKRLGSGGDHAFARALLRETRWDTPEAGAVPILGEPGAVRVAWHLVRLRLHRAAEIVAPRLVGACVGGGSAGAVGGAVGGLLLALAPGSTAPPAVVPVMATIGTVCGALAGGGVGAGLLAAESAMRSRRTLAIGAGTALGGGLVGLAVQMLARSTLQVLVGLASSVGGGLEGVVIGGAAGIGYALATAHGTAHANGGLAAPRGHNRWRAAFIVAGTCAAAALILSLSGRPLVGGTIHIVARVSSTGQGLLTPLGRLIGEPDFGPVTAALIAMGEGATFGFGLTLGLTRRP